MLGSWELMDVVRWKVIKNEIASREKKQTTFLA